ncbi:PREDICTED: chymotrypsin-2-like, partial [Nicrophorus vespilloides]|uniref:Chymotrypsin-2-like n=1 Tax=Nicrophorus vespilloides TaxID=110193 RepID=A0ABM1N5P6_NICVS
MATTILTFLISSILQQALSDSFAPKIVGGKTAGNEFLYQVHITDGVSLYCSGSILSEYWILTHAGCIAKNETFYVVAGTVSANSRDGNYHEIAESFKHDSDNIALIKLKTSIELSNFVQAVNLPDVDEDGNLNCVFSSWGKQDFLQYINVTTLSNAECQERLPYDLISDTLICTNNEEGCGACFGDFGGPLVTRGRIQIGLLKTIHGCTLGDPDIFIRIYKYVKW